MPSLNRESALQILGITPPVLLAIESRLDARTRFSDLFPDDWDEISPLHRRAHNTNCSENERKQAEQQFTQAADFLASTLIRGLAYAVIDAHNLAAAKNRYVARQYGGTAPRN